MENTTPGPSLAAAKALLGSQVTFNGLPVGRVVKVTLEGVRVDVSVELVPEAPEVIPPVPTPQIALEGPSEPVYVAPLAAVPVHRTRFRSRCPKCEGCALGAKGSDMVCLRCGEPWPWPIEEVPVAGVLHAVPGVVAVERGPYGPWPVWGKEKLRCRICNFMGVDRPDEVCVFCQESPPSVETGGLDLTHIPCNLCGGLTTNAGRICQPCADRLRSRHRNKPRCPVCRETVVSLFGWVCHRCLQHHGGTP